jgi:hypothetical protein
MSNLERFSEDEIQIQLDIPLEGGGGLLFRGSSRAAEEARADNSAEEKGSGNGETKGVTLAENTVQNKIKGEERKLVKKKSGFFVNDLQELLGNDKDCKKMLEEKMLEAKTDIRKVKRFLECFLDDFAQHGGGESKSSIVECAQFQNFVGGSLVVPVTTWDKRIRLGSAFTDKKEDTNAADKKEGPKTKDEEEAKKLKEKELLKYVLKTQSDDAAPSTSIKAGNAHLFRLKHITLLVNPAHDFLGALLALPPWAQARIFQSETVGAVLQIKEAALERTIARQWIEFAVFMALVVSQSYAVRETAAALHRLNNGGGGEGVGWNVGRSGNAGLGGDGALFERSIFLITVVFLYNLLYAFDEIKATLKGKWIWETESPVRKSLDVMFEFWGETSNSVVEAIFGNIDIDEAGCGTKAAFYSFVFFYLVLSALLALVAVPTLAVVYPLYAHLNEDIWNAIDIIYTSLVWVSLGYHIYCLIILSSGQGGGSITTATFGSETITRLTSTALSVAGWAIVFVGLRLLSYFRSTRTMGPIIAMIVAIIRDMLPFLVVLVLLMASGAFAMPLLMNNLDRATARDRDESVLAGDGFVDPWRSFLTIYMWLNGDWDAEPYANHTGAMVYFYFFLLVTSIVMMNLLIAIMGDSFARVREQEEVQTRIVIAQMIHEIEGAMEESNKSRPWYHRCRPHFLQPWCRNDQLLNPVAVLRVVKDVDDEADDDDDDDDEPLTDRVTKVRKAVEKMKEDSNDEFKRLRDEAVRGRDDANDRANEAHERAKKAETAAIHRVDDLKNELESKTADARAADMAAAEAQFKAMRDEAHLANEARAEAETRAAEQVADLKKKADAAKAAAEAAASEVTEMKAMLARVLDGLAAKAEVEVL